MNIEAPKNTTTNIDYTDILTRMKELYKDKDTVDNPINTAHITPTNTIDKVLYNNGKALEIAKKNVDTAYNTTHNDASTVNMYTIDELHNRYIESDSEPVDGGTHTFWSNLIAA